MMAKRDSRSGKRSGSIPGRFSFPRPLQARGHVFDEVSEQMGVPARSPFYRIQRRNAPARSVRRKGWYTYSPTSLNLNCQQVSTAAWVSLPDPVAEQDDPAVPTLAREDLGRKASRWAPKRIRPARCRRKAPAARGPASSRRRGSDSMPARTSLRTRSGSGISP